MESGALLRDQGKMKKDLRGSHFPALKDKLGEFETDFGVVDRWRNHG